MRKLLFVLLSSVAIVSAAKAADVAEADPIPVAAYYDWSGAYAGLYAAGIFGRLNHSGTVTGVGSASASSSPSGFLGGIQAGYDWQFDKTVVGVVADIGWSSMSSTVSGVISGVTGTARTKLNYVGTVRGRIGYAYDKTLIYGHGGFAYGQTKQTLTATGFAPINTSKTKVGYTLGAGAEYAFTNNLSMQGEYSFTDLGRDTYLTTGAFGPAATVSEKLYFHTLKAAINYRF